MATLRRGFKTEANAIAREVRAELGLAASSPLDIWALAEHLAIPLRPLHDLKATVPDAVRHFTSVERGAFSAVTVFAGQKRVIVYNDRHSKERQASNLAHELAHALLLHPPQVALNEYGCRIWSKECEKEADWLGGALLVSEEAALFVVRRGFSIGRAAALYGVSVKMMRFRLNVTGAMQRASRVS